MSGHVASSADRTLRETVRFYLVDHRTPLGKLIDVALLLLNLVFVALFALQTYPFSRGVTTFLWYVEVAIASVFLIEYGLRLYAAHERFEELTDPYSAIDIVSLVPTFSVLVLSALGVPALNVGFLGVARVVRVLRFFRFTSDEEFFFGTVSVGTLRAMKLVLTVLSIFYVGGGLFYSVEAASNPAVNTFGDAFYFTVVALTTVGFGDIVPVTEAGRWVTVSAILAGVVLIPWQASKIVRTWTNKEQVNAVCPECGLASHDPDASHCKACGHVIYQEFDSQEGGSGRR